MSLAHQVRHRCGERRDLKSAEGSRSDCERVEVHQLEPTAGEEQERNDGANPGTQVTEHQRQLFGPAVDEVACQRTEQHFGRKSALLHECSY